MAKRVLVKHTIEDNSIIVNCYDPKNAENILLRKIEKSSHINNIAMNKLTNYFTQTNNLTNYFPHYMGLT